MNAISNIPSGVIVADVFRLALPASSSLLAGSAGLNRRVGWARVSRASMPTFDYLNAGDLALLSHASLRSAITVEGPEALLYIVERLAQEQVAALAISTDADEMSPQVCAIADANKLPLFHLPQLARLHDIERSVIGLIMDRDAELQRRQANAQRTFAQLGLEGAGVPAIVNALALQTGKPAVLESAPGRIQYAALAEPAGNGGRSDLDPVALVSEPAAVAALQTWADAQLPSLRSGVAPAGEFALGDGAAWSRIVMPLLTREGPAGYLSVLSTAGSLSDLDALILRPAALTIVAEITKERAIQEAQRRAGGDFLDELLAANRPPDETLLARARRVGYDLSLPHVIIKLGLDPVPAGLPLKAADSNAFVQFESFLARLDHDTLEIDGKAARPIIKIEHGTALILHPLANQRKSRATHSYERTGDHDPQVSYALDLAESIRQEAAAQLEATGVSAGIAQIGPDRAGLITHLSELPSLLQEADQALNLGRQVFGGARVTYYGDLRLYRLLLPLADSSLLQSFCAEMLGKLTEHDRSGELLHTLEVYFDRNCNVSRTALPPEQGGLGVHRNTLIYRLERIHQITGLDLDDPEIRLSLQVALKARHVLEGIGRSYGKEG